MKFTWDPRKNAANIAKHGFDFRDAAAVFDGPIVIRPDRRRNYGEERFVAIGVLEGIFLTVVYTDRGSEERRIISVRQSNRKERRIFQEEADFANRLGASAPNDGQGD
jgi:uncharacterized protein